MMTFRVLGAFWFAICCYYSFNLLHTTFTYHPKRPPSALFWYGYTLAGCMVLVGIMASVELILGATWARWPLSLLFIFEMVYCYSRIVMHPKKRLRIRDHIILAFALVSLVILFWPGHV